MITRFRLLTVALSLGAVILSGQTATKSTAKAPVTASTATKSTAKAGFVPYMAPEFVIKQADGSEKILTSYRGKKVVVMAFMYTTCPHCQHTAGVLAKIQTEYEPKGAQVLGVTFDTAAQKNLPGFIQMTGANFPVGYSTPELVTKFMRSGDDYYVPMLAFIDKTGMVRYQVISHGEPNSDADKFLADQETTIRRQIDKYLAAPTTAAK